VLGQNPLEPPLDLVESLAAAVTGEQDFSRPLVTALLQGKAQLPFQFLTGKCFKDYEFNARLCKRFPQQMRQQYSEYVKLICY
jgi:hypothetical protein